MVKCRIDPADQINFQVTVKSFSHQWGSIMTLKLPDLSVKTSLTTLIPGNGLIELCRLFPGIVFQWVQFDLLHQNLGNQFFFIIRYFFYYSFFQSMPGGKKERVKSKKIKFIYLKFNYFVLFRNF